jgi:hypothetical protein
MERKTKSAFKLKSGNKPSPAKLMGIVGRAAKKYRDDIKSGKKTRPIDKIKAGVRAVATEMGETHGSGKYGPPTLSEMVSRKYKRFKRGYRRKQAQKNK